MLLAALLAAAGQLSPAQTRAPQAGAVDAAKQADGSQSGGRLEPIPESALPGSESDEWMGRRVDEIRITTVGDERQLLRLLPLQPGDLLAREKLRESMRVLYRTGRFSDLIADATLLPSGGVAVQFRTTPNYFNGRVTVIGLPKRGPGESQVVSTGRLELGALFTEAKLKDSEQRILRLLHENGYWQALVTEELSRHEDTQQVDVQFEITAGVPARIGRFTLTGDPTLSSEEAARICKMQPGKLLRGELLQRGIDRLRKRYAKEKRLRAQITATAPVFHAETNTVDYNLVVERGPVVEISAEGFKVSHGKLKQLVPVWEEHAVDEDLLNEGRRNLRDYLQSQGYFDATVEVQQQENPAHDRQQIIFVLHPGQKHRLRAIQIEGNKRFATGTIHERMGTQTSGFLLPHGRYSQSLLSADTKSIEALYRSNGYPSAKATSEVIDDYAGKPGDMKLVIKIEEGPLVKVGRLDIAGAHAFDESELRSMMNTREGQPYSESTIVDDREVLLAYYFNHGFPAVQIESSVKHDPSSPDLMDVGYEIREGPQEFVNRILVSGIEHTKTSVVKRAIVIKPSAPLSQEKMLLTQRNFYDLGIFTEVQTAIQNPEGDETFKNVLFQIQEARRWTIDYGFGLEAGSGLNTTQGGPPQGQTGVSPRGTLNITRINFRGKGESLIFKSHVGTLQKRVSISYDQPHWFDLPNWRMTYTGLYDNTRDVNTFTSSREEFSSQLTERVSKSTQMLYRFSYRRVVVDPSSFPAGFTASLIPLYSQPVRVGMPSVTYLRDTRDDPVNSTRGTFTTVDIGVANSAFGSQADFARALVQHSSYYRLRRGWVLARSTRVGVESSYGGVNNIVPLPERFFAGGSNSLRGFAINQAGPRDLGSGFPVGGDGMFVNNVELRSPAVPLPKLGENLSFVVFNDVGNVFETSNQMWHNLWRFTQRAPSSCVATPGNPSTACDFNFMSAAIGGGIRYRTPIGPVRLDLGYNLNPPLFPVNFPSPCVADPTVFCAGTHSEQLHHFNFFFSIGQTF